MNVNEPNHAASTASAATARARTEAASAPDLAELVRSLCALAADSPERQAKIRDLIRAYATGTLQLDPEATASAMIDDAFGARRTRC